ncbi:FAD-binding protein [Maricaulis sp.]|uniref:FAD-binding protein n=1 Tax=Maricaulis sp. TaxID=1486257 RepID=UPI0026399357|nr:FAD-binding protein [Maricaulis sp.]
MIETSLQAQLEAIVGTGFVLTGEAECYSYSYDAYGVHGVPRAVVLPATPGEAVEVVRALRAAGQPFLARGSGTGYAGGCVAVRGEVLIVTTRLKTIRAIDTLARTVEVDAGVVTADLQAAVARQGLYYPPDPSSYAVCTIGGNLATNAGGPHCLGYGVTSNYVTEIEYVTPQGELEWVGSSRADRLDIRGLMVGAESALGLITGARLRLIPQPGEIKTLYAEFDDNAAGAAAIMDMFSKGLKPIALDMTAGVYHPRGAPLPFANPCVLYIEVHGAGGEVEHQSQAIKAVVEGLGGRAEIHSKSDLMKRRYEVTRERWRGVASSFNLPNYFLFDAVVKRSDLALMMERIEDEAKAADFIVANTFHAGDGNIHPTPFYDPREPGIQDRLEIFRDRILRHVRDLGGALTGEHGIGLEKTHLMGEFFGAAALETMHAVQDLFQPAGAGPDRKLLPPRTSTQAAPPRGVFDALDICPADGYAVFPAETSWNDVREALSETGYELPYDPIGCFEAFSLGETVMAGAPNLREMRFGPARDLLLGGVLTARSGRAIEFGSVFAKDVSGFDLRKLVFGSQTRLGELDRLAVKLEPRPRFRHVVRLRPHPDCDVEALIATLMQPDALTSSIWLKRTDSRIEVGALIEANADDRSGWLKAQGVSSRAGLEFLPWDGRANSALGIDAGIYLQPCEAEASAPPDRTGDGLELTLFAPPRHLRAVDLGRARADRPLVSTRDNRLAEAFHAL